MDRFVVLVDAGYLLSQAVKVLSAKKSRTRAELQLHDAPGLIQMLVSKAASALKNDRLLRVYWYDGIKGGLSPEHQAIIEVDNVQLRTGTINGKGQQKGVDSKIVIDLIELATNQAISDAMIVTGDGDLAIGVELSQRRGIRVAVLGVEDLNVGITHSQSTEVTNVADLVIRIGSADLSPYVSYVPKGTAPSAAAPLGTTVSAPSHVPVSPTPPEPIPQPATAAQPDIPAAVQAFIRTQSPPLSSAVVGTTGAIDKSVDKALIHHVYKTLGQGALTDLQKRLARAVFRKLMTMP